MTSRAVARCPRSRRARETAWNITCCVWVQMPRQLEIVDPFTPRADSLWRGLEEATRPAYFLTWGWVENWLAMLPRSEAPQLAMMRDGGEVTGAFFLGRRTLLRHGVLPSRAAFVNATGIPSRDELCIEHNGILGRGCSL